MKLAWSWEPLVYRGKSVELDGPRWKQTALGLMSVLAVVCCATLPSYLTPPSLLSIPVL